jgi:lysozyme
MQKASSCSSVHARTAIRTVARGWAPRYGSDAYDDEAGHCTIGYGHLIHTGPCDEEELNQHVTRRQGAPPRCSQSERTVRRKLKTDLNQNQFDALVSFVYNVGPKGSAGVLELANKGELDKVPAKMREYHFVTATDKKTGHKKKRTSAILVRRRRHESALFERAVEPTPTK